MELPEVPEGLTAAMLCCSVYTCVQMYDTTDFSHES